MPSALTPDNFMAQQNLDPDSFMALFGTNPADAILAKQGISAAPAGQIPKGQAASGVSPVRGAPYNPSPAPPATDETERNRVDPRISLTMPLLGAVTGGVSAVRAPIAALTGIVGGAAARKGAKALGAPDIVADAAGIAGGIAAGAGASRIGRAMGGLSPEMADAVDRIPGGKLVRLLSTRQAANQAAQQGERLAAANRAANPPVNVGEVGPAGSSAPVPEFIPETPTQTPSGRVPGNSPAYQPPAERTPPTRTPQWWNRTAAEEPELQPVPPVEPQALPSGRMVGPAPQRPQAPVAPAPMPSTDPLPPGPLEVPRAPNSVTSPTPGGIVDRSAMNNMIHAVGARLGMDHEMLSDAARRTYRVKSMTQMSEDQMLDMYSNLLKKSPVGSPLPLKTTGKPSELSLEDQLRQSIAATLKRRAATAGPVEPLPPGALE